MVKTIKILFAAMAAALAPAAGAATATASPTAGTAVCDMQPVDAVRLIGDKLIRTTGFDYCLELPADGPRFDGTRIVDFGRTFGCGTPAAAYAYTRLHADNDTVIKVEIEHNDACRIWCNGSEVYRRDGARGLAFAKDERSMELSFSFDLPLRRGYNDLLVKSSTAGGEWVVMMQPPSFKDAVLSREPRYVGIGLDGLKSVSPEVAALSRWLVAGPFPADMNGEFGPEQGTVIGRMYKGLADKPVTWTIPKVEVLGNSTGRAPWGSTCQWNYHNGGVAWAMQRLARYTGCAAYDQWARRFCDYHMEGMPFVDYQVNSLYAFNSANNTILDCPLLDFTLAPALPFVDRLNHEEAFPNRPMYEKFIGRMMDYAAKGQVRSPGMSNYARVTPEKYTVWVDDMFMGIPFLMQAAEYDPARAEAFREDAARQITDFSRHVWDPAAKLYSHASYTSRPDVRLPHWSRANGWALWAMTEVLDGLPARHPRRKEVLKRYRELVESLCRYQGADGLWHNVVDRPDSRPETSGSAIFVMGIARGVVNGGLDERKYTPVVEKGWRGIASRIDADGTVNDICVGTMCSTDEEYYVNRPFYKDDTHGSFAVIFAGIAVQEMLDLQRPADTDFTPVRPTADEIAILKRDLESRHAAYDDEACMLRTVTSGRHYHSDLDSGVVVHQTRESLDYAVALLKTGDSKLRARGMKIVRRVLPLQETDPRKPYCGVWPYYPEDPLAGRKAPVDYNWADFIAVPLIDVLTNHSDLLDSATRDEIRWRLELAADAIKRRDVQPDYTNICLMGAYVCYAVGDICGRGDLKYYARQRLRNFHEYTLATGGFTEYNSPTYTVVALDELLRMKRCIINKEDLALVDDLYTMAWDMVGRHYHSPSGQWCGPNLRAYSNLATNATKRLFYNASDGAIELPGDYARIPDILAPHRIPASAMESFRCELMPREVVDTFYCAPEGDNVAAIVGKLYQTPGYALASVNKGYMWNQCRPLVAHCGTAEKPCYVRVRFLHDNYDYAGVNIHSAQRGATVLSVMNVATDGGDTHPSIDRLADGILSAKELCLRVEIGGDLADADIILPETPDGCLTIAVGGRQFCVRVPYVKWGEITRGEWRTGRDNNSRWADYVIYDGPRRGFDLKALDGAALALYLSAVDGGNQAPADADAVADGEYLTLASRDMSVKALLRPAPESRVSNDFAVRYTDNDFAVND